jgi:sulfur transfer complex TusBCD TusB component (DsrH family)
MWVLFVVVGLQKSVTVFRLAERMARDGQHVVFLFAGDSRRHAEDPELMKSLRFTKGVHILKGDGGWKAPRSDLPEGVEAVDYDGWVGLLEACDSVVSWA